VCDEFGDNCASSKSVPPGTPLILTWSSTNANSCNRISGPDDFDTHLERFGDDSITANTASGMSDIYVIGCGNADGSATKQVTVNTSLVGPTLTASETMVRIGSVVSLRWDTNNTPGDENDCSLTGGGLSGYNPIPLSGNSEQGETSVTIAGRTTFTLRCPNGTASKTVDVIPEEQET
jgi:hypothetical protein